jgi:hypothetical protein
MIKNLETLYFTAKQASKLKTLEEREKNYNFLIREMKILIGFCKSNKKLRKISKTIENGLNAWFTAILEQDIEFTNNRAEGEIENQLLLGKF